MTPSHDTLAQLGTLPEYQKASIDMQLEYLRNPGASEAKDGTELVDADFVAAYLFLYYDQTVVPAEQRDAIRNDVRTLIYARLSSPEDYLTVLQQAETNGKRIQANRGPLGALPPDTPAPLLEHWASLRADHWATLEEPAKWACHPYFYRVHPEDLAGSTEGIAIEE